MELPNYNSYKEFIDNFEDNFKKYQKQIPDADVQDFAKEYIEEYKWLCDVDKFDNIIFNDTLDSYFLKDNSSDSYRAKYKNFKISAPKIVGFLAEKAGIKLQSNYLKVKATIDLFNDDISLSEFNKKITTQIKPKPKFETNITQTELVELVKALKENGTIQGTQKDLINAFADFFGIEINNQNKLIQDIRKRNNGSETLFLDALKNSLFDYLSK